MVKTIKTVLYTLIVVFIFAFTYAIWHTYKQGKVNAQELEIGMWLKGVTPNFHTQTNKYPHAVNIPISCGGTLVMPGDIIVADDDGAVVVPQTMAEELVEAAGAHSDWEVWVRQKLASGGHLKDYYGRTAWSKETDDEYKQWCDENNVKYVSLEEELKHKKK